MLKITGMDGDTRNRGAGLVDVVMRGLLDRLDSVVRLLQVKEQVLRQTL